MKKKKVLFIAETATGGSAISLFNLVRELKKGSYVPYVLFVKENNPHIANLMKEQGIWIHSFDNKKLGGSQILQDKQYSRKGQITPIGDQIKKNLGEKPAQFYYSLKSSYLFIRYQAALILPIFKVIKKNQIDILHLNNGLQNGQSAILAAKLAGIPVVCHNRMFSEWTGFEKLFIGLVKKYIFISKAVADHFKKLGIPEDRSKTIYNALDLSDFSCVYDTEIVRNEFGWNGKHIVVGVVGRLAKWKGQHVFLKAMAQVCEKMPMARGLIVGEASNFIGREAFFQGLVSQRDKLGLKEKVIFTGFRKDTACLMAAMDVIVHCSTRPEPFGRVVIEGMASGKPVIATSAGGVPEILEDKLTGLLIPEGDSRAIARAIIRVLSDKAAAKKMSTKARQSVEKKFTIKDHTMKIQQEYDDILAI